MLTTCPACRPLLAPFHPVRMRCLKRNFGSENPLTPAVIPAPRVQRHHAGYLPRGAVNSPVGSSGCTMDLDLDIERATPLGLQRRPEDDL